MTNEQIAHDLAIARLCGSDLPINDLIKKYRQYYEEILSALKSEPTIKKPSVIMNSPI